MGSCDGFRDGIKVGRVVGLCDGACVVLMSTEGIELGDIVVIVVEICVGICVGDNDGDAVGFIVDEIEQLMTPTVVVYELNGLFPFA